MLLMGWLRLEWLGCMHSSELCNARSGRLTNITHDKTVAQSKPDGS